MRRVHVKRSRIFQVAPSGPQYSKNLGTGVTNTNTMSIQYYSVNKLSIQCQYNVNIMSIQCQYIVNPLTQHKRHFVFTGFFHTLVEPSEGSPFFKKKIQIQIQTQIEVKPV